MSKGGRRPGSGRKKGSIPWNKGLTMSDETKKKVSEAKKGTPAWNKGKPMSEETKRKLSAIRKGRPSPWKGRTASPETREKMRLAKLGKTSNHKGKKMSLKAVEKMAASKRGKEHSIAHREANRQGQINRYLKINPLYQVRGRNRKIIENGGHHSNKDWEKLKEKYLFTCPACQRKEPEIKLTRDHIVALLNGGSNSIENIQPLCLKCNISKHVKTIRY